MRRSVKPREWRLVDRALVQAIGFGFVAEQLAPDFRNGISVEVMNPHFTK